MPSVLSEFLASFPNNSVTIQRFSEVTNDIWEKIKTWSPIYSDKKCIFDLTSQQWDDNEVAQKQLVKAKYFCRLELVDIWEAVDATEITNVTEKDRVVIWSQVYQISFVHWALWDVNLIDHCVLFLNLID